MEKQSNGTPNGPVTFEQAVASFRDNLKSLDFLQSRTEELVRYVFGDPSAPSCFWNWYQHFKTTDPVPRKQFAITFYGQDQQDKLRNDPEKPKSRDYKKKMLSIVMPINDLCEEGFLANEILEEWHRRYVQRIEELYNVNLKPRLGRPINLIVELRNMIHDKGADRETISRTGKEIVASVIKNGPPLHINFMLSFLLEVFKSCFSEEDLATMNTKGNCYRFVNAGLEACGLNDSAVLDSRLDTMAYKEAPLVEYDEKADRFDVSDEMRRIMDAPLVG